MSDIVERVTVTIHLADDAAEVLRDLRRLGFDDDETGLLIGLGGEHSIKPTRLLSASSIVATTPHGVEVVARRAPA